MYKLAARCSGGFPGGSRDEDLGERSRQALDICYDMCSDICSDI